jgi:hypothetical protein
MSTPNPIASEYGFGHACALVEQALAGLLRRQFVAAACEARDLGSALLHVRGAMRGNVWRGRDTTVNLHRAITRYDVLTRQEGFHALHDWDGKAGRVNDDTIPVDVLNFVVDQRGGDAADPAVAAMLVDYYFVHVLALLSLRVWDEGDADENLDRLGKLLGQLQGPDGSGQRFASDPETLILIATCHYEPDERGYVTLLDRVHTLSAAHRASIAMTHAAAMGSHLRFGFEATYGRDTSVMRDDNVADYPWLCFSLVTLMREYARMHAAGEPGVRRDALVEAMVNGLSADARAFIGVAPASLSRCETERCEFRDLFLRYRGDLEAEFERCRPTEQAYSPLSFFFNFSHNVLKGTIVDALLRGKTWDVTINDLLTGLPRDDPRAADKAALATTLMGYARASPDTIRGRLTPVIVYDPAAGRQAFAVTMKKLRESAVV